MKTIKLAIIGRPNVGKSCLFNKLCRKNISIVNEEEGITRDRLYGKASYLNNMFEVIDTAGIDPYNNHIFNEEIIYQSKLAIEEADVIVMVVDVKVGITKLDEDVSKLLLKTNKRVVLAVNKIDTIENEYLKNEFYSLGIKNIIGISALNGVNIDVLLQNAFEKITWPEKENIEDFSKITIIGRSNVGKSTLFNSLLNEKRSVVSDLPATTRDNIDMHLQKDGKSYLFIDTAGLRKKRKEKDSVEKFARLRTEKAVKRANICMLIIDAVDGFTDQEKKIVDLIQKEGKGFILIVNKWDKIKDFQMEHAKMDLLNSNSFLNNYPILFISAKNKRNIDKIFPLIEKLNENLNRVISTGALNKFVERCMQKYHPPMIKGKRLRIYYLTQKSVFPHKFILFVNAKRLLTRPYKRYLINNLRKSFDLLGSCVYFEIRDKKLNQS